MPDDHLRAGTVKARRPRGSAGGAKRSALDGAEHRCSIVVVMAGGVDATPDADVTTASVDIECDAREALLSRTATGRKASANATSLWPTFSGRTGPDRPEDLGRNQSRSMRQTRGASRRRTSCAQQPAATETAMVWATPPDRRGATSGARSGVAHAMVSSSDCDRDARQRAAKSAAGFTDSHADDAEVSEHERNAARHRARRLRRSPAETRRGSR